MKAFAVIMVGLLISPMLGGADGEPKSPPFSLVAEQEPTSRAERYLLELALDAKRARSLGYVCLGAGAAMLAGGIVVIAGVDDSDGFEGFFEALGGIALLGGGATAMVGGVGVLLIANGPERRYAVVRSLSDSVERERASRDALTSLARSGKAKRYVSGGILSALAAYTLASSSEAQSVLVLGALAAFQFLRKSREERAYKSFLADEDMPRESIDVGFGPGPHGGLRLVLTASF
ncbi:MAG: hypothetical protein ACXW2R_05205 [Candidatus Aminicenantales bacterium]